MKKNIILAIIVVAIIGSIFYLQQPDSITDGESGEEITLGAIGDRIPAEVGNTAQDFRLTDYMSFTHQLSSLRGKVVVLNFWASWCPFCLEEMPLFEAVHQKYKDKGVEVIAINRGEALFEAKRFTQPLELDFTLLLDKEDSVYSAYNLQAMPTTFLIDQEGVIQEIKFGAFTEEELMEKVQKLYISMLKSKT